MKTSRWLLPFTHGVDMCAIEYAVRLAEYAGATLVTVSLISTPPKGARLEYIQQSKDFLEAVQHKAERIHVPLERYEVYTTDVQQSLHTLVRERSCDGILLVTGGEGTRLLQDYEVKQLLICPPAALVIIRMPTRESLALLPSLWARFSAWLRGFQRQQDATWQPRDEETWAVEEPEWIRTEQHYVG